MIYLAKDEIYLKIGYSQNSNLHRRWMELQIGNPRELEFRIFDEFATLADEQKLHKKYINQHFRGEWFLIDEKLQEIWNNSKIETHNKHIGRPRIIMSQAVNWLSKLMKNGPILASEARKKGKEAGFSTKTIWRAGEEIHIKREPIGISNKIIWSL